VISITAILRAKPGEEAKLLAALLDVAAHVRANEPDTLGFHVSRDLENPAVFTTYERFADRAAMDAHNGSDAVARFFHIARPILDGPATLHSCHEVDAVTQ
jgi:quinol monooxygenase YgiN